ncbi:MAG TPA: DUF1707 domain-containing protein [Gaiellaceae bacterium]|nr:DUF1707 domain-containing protein [Gaiellaceae bacterium]
MSETPALRASDADRERAIALLRDHAAEGRLTLEEFTERMSAAYLARTNDEVEELVRDLPSAGAAVVSRRRPTRFLFSVLGSTEREGRIRVRRRVSCLMGFGNIDFDLRQATLEGDVITIVALGAFGAIDVYVPEGVEVDLHGFALGGHKRARGNDPPPRPGTPLVRVFAVSIFAGIDVWRVPIAWTQKTWREVIRGIRSGAHKELEA